MAALAASDAIIALYEGNEEPYIDLEQGRTDGVLLDNIIADRYGCPRSGVVCLPGDVARGTYVIGIRKSDPDLKRANLAEAMLHPSFELVEADVRDSAAMRRVIDAFHPYAIVHLAARAGVRPSIQDPALYTAVNVLGT